LLSGVFHVVLGEDYEMAIIVGFISQKGGVGKSTLARALAREAAAGGMNVKIADLDTQQGTIIDWQRLRLSRNISPIVSVESFATANQAIIAATGFDLLIIDGPARTNTGTLEIARHADLLIHPTGASRDDLVPAVREFHALIKASIPNSRLRFALNRIGTDAEEIATRAWLEEAGYTVLAGSLRDRPAYRQAQNEGKSITETRFHNLNERADTLIQSLIDGVTQNG
jgi:chromosome partitioning protein